MIENQILELVIRYLAQEITFESFRDSFDQLSWEDSSADSLVSTIELWLAEYSAGHRSEEEVRVQLAGLVRVVRVDVQSTSSSLTYPVITSSDSVTLQSARFDKELAEAS
jgi:hypothetical protein